MKSLVVAATILLAGSMAMAQSIDLPGLKFATESGWAIGMVEQACQVRFDKSLNLKGSILKNEDGSVEYVVLSQGKVIKVVGAAAAESTWIGAEKICTQAPRTK